ncbi:MAG: LysM peptidoglycan-binding domain-containing protein [Egibacteraceae bacterium]
MNTRMQHVVPPTRTTRQLLPLLAWVAALGAAIGLLLLMGRGGLSTPSVLEPSAWPAWATGRDPLEVAFAVLRLVGLAAAWYLLGATTIGVVARLLRWGRLIDAADILTVPSVRRLLQTALGLGLATAAVTGTTMGHGVAPDSPGAVVAVQDAAAIVPISTPGPVSPATSTQVPPAVAAQALQPVSTLAPPSVSGEALPSLSVPASPAVSGQAPSPLPATAALAVPAVPATAALAVPAVAAPAPQPVAAPAVSAAERPAPAPQERGTYVVRHGDHLWGIAEETLEKAWGYPPTDEQIVPYWQQLIEINRAVLVDPGNPDLILPGQTFTVPPPLLP